VTLSRRNSRSRTRHRSLRAAPLAAVVLLAWVIATAVGQSSAVSVSPCAKGGAAQIAAWRPDMAAVIAYARTRRGDISFAVRTNQHFWGYRDQHVVATASVLKAMLLVAYLELPSVRNRHLTGADTALLAPMIRVSDNTAATAVRNIVGDGRLVALARAVGMRHFRTNPVWGLSETTAFDQTKFFLHIERYIALRHRSYALRLLASIVPSQRWGIGRIALPGWAVYFKGGWGSGTGAVDHQVVLVVHGCSRVSLAVMTIGDGTHAYGKQTLYGVAVRLVDRLPRFRAAASRGARPALRMLGSQASGRPASRDPSSLGCPPGPWGCNPPLSLGAPG
jgi:Beta-lactamase enzyme family